MVPRTRVELARPCEHQPLKLACLPISPPGQMECKDKMFFNNFFNNQIIICNEHKNKCMAVF